MLVIYGGDDPKDDIDELQECAFLDPFTPSL
jgi:hypothetical protein